ncbi:hypothetical protein B9Z55_020833 [Caenorhabditis nigoni]|uniref:F-box domain-containing protein n=1 Tax=Caenorhabditis nigoni TaxID=1611254 RepID=A0A2G5TQ66_9PELO|nr:hypothetical protein B9Z55_020833 [Caenorhabditis nigoni]
MVSLLDMPDVPMNLIISHVGPLMIFSLRKVCRSLRDYFDETKPESHFSEIGIRMGYKKLQSSCATI